MLVGIEPEVSFSNPFSYYTDDDYDKCLPVLFSPESYVPLQQETPDELTVIKNFVRSYAQGEATKKDAYVVGSMIRTLCDAKHPVAYQKYRDYLKLCMKDPVRCRKLFMDGIGRALLAKKQALICANQEAVKGRWTSGAALIAKIEISVEEAAQIIMNHIDQQPFDFYHKLTS